MPEIGTYGSMSGDGKRGDAAWPKLPRPSSTLPILTIHGQKLASIRPTGSRWAIPDPMYGPAVRCKGFFVDLVGDGLASMYPASRWSVAPGHHGYQRACDLISG